MGASPRGQQDAGPSGAREPPKRWDHTGSFDFMYKVVRDKVASVVPACALPRLSGSPGRTGHGQVSLEHLLEKCH